MEKNQFYYNYREPLPLKEGETETKYIETRKSFNVNMVIMTILLDDGKLGLVLNDQHERIEEVPVKNKQGKITSYKNAHYTHQTTLYLEKEDAERFIKLTSIEE